MIIKQIVKYVEIKCQLGATEVFIADLIVCSTCFDHHYAHHQELKRLLPVVFDAVIFKYHRQQPLYNTLELLVMGIMVPETC